MTASSIYTSLDHPDSIRLLEIDHQCAIGHQMSGRLTSARLNDRPDYYALSYVWGQASESDPVFFLNGCPLTIRFELYKALEALSVSKKSNRLWIDQICIDQQSDMEKQQQVQLMSKIFSRARRVIGLLGERSDDSDNAFKLLSILGLLSEPYPEGNTTAWQKDVDDLIQSGHLRDMIQLFDSTGTLGQSVASLVNRPWFRRLWIVQEVALAVDLELRCGNASISGHILFAGIQALCSTVHDPPSPWLLGPYRNAHRLGLLRTRISEGRRHSLLYLAQKLSEWDCEKSHDRLNALFGIAFRENSTNAWFKPSYAVTGPELYMQFATSHIRTTRGLHILHSAGCSDSAAFILSSSGDKLKLELIPPPNDVPSWTPDWRIKSRPLEMLCSDGVNSSGIGFSTTLSNPQYILNDSCRTLFVRASLLDKVKICGIPYCPSLYKDFNISEQLFNLWFQLAKENLDGFDVEPMFATTLVMDGRVSAVERDVTAVQPGEIMELFRHWARRNLDGMITDAGGDRVNGIDESTRYGYFAEEICRNRTFFITERGRMGLGSMHASPGTCIYGIHGLSTPFLLHSKLENDVLRGECYVHGLMYSKVQYSESDVFLRLA